MTDTSEHGRMDSKRCWGTLIAVTCGVVFFALLVGSATLGQGPPAPPHPPPPGTKGPPPPPRPLDAWGVGERIGRARSGLANIKPKDSEGETLVSMARVTLERATHALRANDLNRADRLEAAAEAFRRAVEHQQHIGELGKRPGPQPQAREIGDHLEKVYFRLQQADFFVSASGEEDAKALPSIARRFYERARQAYDKGAWVEADECAKSADDTLHGLENLAQAAQQEPQARDANPR